MFVWFSPEYFKYINCRSGWCETANIYDVEKIYFTFFKRLVLRGFKIPIFLLDSKVTALNHQFWWKFKFCLQKQQIRQMLSCSLMIISPRFLAGCLQGWRLSDVTFLEMKISVIFVVEEKFPGFAWCWY